MRLRLLLLTLAGITIALVFGWFVDPPKVENTVNPLQVPDNIDYYLAGVRYQDFSESGEPKLQLQTPYLEHFIREDVSQLESPRLQYFTANEEWHLTATQGMLQHASDTFVLTHKARLQRVNESNPFLLTTDKLVFHSAEEQLEAPQALQVRSDGLQLQAANALLDMRTKQHRLSRVKATYHRRSNHAPG